MQKRWTMYILLLLAALALTGCAAGAETHTGEARGYGGPLRVTVEMQGADITAVRVTHHSETQGVGTRAIEAMPALIVAADTPDVDGVSGATVTSQAIREAVAQAIAWQGDITDREPEAEPVYLRSGVGVAATGRLGPGVAEDGSPVYSFNVVFASADFDQAGRLLALDVEQLEVLSTQFTGFPEEKEGERDFLTQVTQWTPKGAQGDAYMMESGSWRQQMDIITQAMLGKTITEINDWYRANYSQETGKPVDNADGLTGATMSLRGEHGDILLAIQRAWEDAQRRADTPASEGTRTDLPDPTREGVMNDTNTLDNGTEDATVG